MDPQQWLAMQTMVLNGNAPPLYNTGQAPDPTAPELDPFAQYVYATGAQPNTDKKGNLLPFNLDYQKSLMNYQQDANQVIADPVNAYMSSLFGGEGFSPGVFDPVKKESPITLTQLPVLQQMASAGGYQGLLAKWMLPTEMGGKGMNPASAAALLQRVMNNPEAAAQTAGIDPAALEQVKSELPPVINTQGMTGPEIVPGKYDWKSVAQDAQQLWQPMAQELAQIKAPGVTQRDGQFYSTTTVDSPQTEFIKKLGIPNPNARYDFQYAVQNDPSIAGLMQHSADTQQQADAMRKTFDQYTKKITKQRADEARVRASDAAKMAAYQSGPLKQWAGKMDVYGDSVKQSMSDYFRQATEAGAALPYPNQDAIDQRDARMGQFQPELRINNLPAGINSDRSMTYPAKAQPDLPDFAWPGARPEAPTLSPYSKGMTADQVSQLFNQATSFLPKTIKNTFNLTPKALDVQQPMMAANLRKANADEKATGMAYMNSLIPFLAMNAAGRTPAKDVIQQRLLPMYTSGAFGQQGLPTAYPQRSAVMSAFGG